MVKEFLKIAGVKTQAEFYKKYPTEAAFFKAHPSAKHLKKMAYGGINAYGYGGGYPSYQDYGQVDLNRGRYMDNEQQYQADMDAYLQSLAANYDTPNAYTAALPMVGPNPMAQSNMVPVNITAPITPQLKYNPYQGFSIYDLLTAQGLPADLKSRKKFAKTLNMSNYRGLPEENAQMIEMIKQNPAILSNYPTSSTKSSSKSATQEVEESPGLNEFIQNEVARQAAANPYIQSAPPQTMPPSNYNWFGAPLGGRSKPSSSSNILPAVAYSAGAAGAGALGYATYKEIKDLLDGIKNNKFQLTGAMKGKLTKLRNKWTKEAGVNIKNQAEWFKKLPKEQQNILKNLDAMEIPGTMHIMRPGSAGMDLYTRRMLDEANAENLLSSSRDTKTALQEAAEEAAALRKARASNAARARWSSAKTANTAEKAGAKASEEASFLQRIPSLLRRIPAIGKFFEAGGENDYSGTYSGGVYYQAGGSYNPTSVNYGPGLPLFNVGATLPEAMYGMGMRFGGPTYSKMTQYNHQQYVPAFDWMQQGGSLTRGGVYDVSEEDVQDLINQGYTIEYL